ncbi:patatin-like phospholipase family protein [Phenylobacterium sp.]|uniref:patatin-like phospholipase family protein n=1 Tax=Phenylobacterium sp. TaxID=1871053 RepID=UPI0025F56765|nr:patatin-like phospholipase family protein [Phenylobacterium sp.]
MAVRRGVRAGAGAGWRSRVRAGWAARNGRSEPPPRGIHAEPEGFGRIRFEGDDGDLTRFLGEPPALNPDAPGLGLKVLALSGGGAGGAFGAGALVGLSRAGARPAFDTVTGVSTGALIAPFAVLGSDWDPRLEAAFTDGYAEEVFALTSARPWPSLYPGERLAALVAHHIDDEVLAAVATVHRAGRRLFVATANLDAQSTSIWDMGAIADTGGKRALELFRSVLVASASLPGIFPPVMLDVESEGRSYQEMHVDGGAIMPLFVVPEALLSHHAQGWRDAEVEIFALVNTPLEPTSWLTPMHAVPILVRSFELMLRSSYRSALRSVAAFCEINGFALRVASLPPQAAGASLLRFDRATMTKLFAEGFAVGESQRLWSAPT